MNEKIHYFTLDEANTLIPRLTEMIQHIQNKKKLYDQRHDEVFMHELLNQVEQNSGYGEKSSDALDGDCFSLEEDLLDLKREIAKLEQLGCIVSDLDVGQIEMPAKIAGEAVYFSWQCGEDSVGYYKRFNDKKAKRIPLSR